MHVLRITPLWDWREHDPPPALTDPRECMGGHAAQAVRLTRATAALGVRQTVLAPRAAGGPAAGELQDGVEVRAVGPAGVPGTHRRMVAWLAGALVGLWRARRDHPDVVHAHASGLFEPLLAALAGSLLLRRPLVLTLHHSAQVTYRARSRRDAAVQVLTRACERAAIRRAARTLTLTGRAALALEGQGRLEVRPDCLDVEAFAGRAQGPAAAALRARLGIPEGAPVALYAGRISVEKGWEAMVRLAQALPELHVLICGDGPDRDALARAAGPRVHLAGALPADEVPVAMGAADVLVLPSEFEELGSVLAEAMAVGLVSVAYATGGVPEAVEPEVTGLLVEPGDEAALAAAVARAVSEPELRERARAEGPRLARERFDAAVAGRRLAALYAEVAGARA